MHADLLRRGGLRHRLIVTHRALSAYRFGASERDLQRDIEEATGIPQCRRTLVRDLMTLEAIGLAELVKIGDGVGWKAKVVSSTKTPAPTVVVRWIAAPAAPPHPSPPPAVPERPRPDVSSLSNTQRLILRQLAAGESSAAIAASLGVATTTIDTHRSRIRKRLGLRTPDALMRFALLAFPD
jgi:DNA-binding CsgD family transcriptional regulator